MPKNMPPSKSNSLVRTTAHNQLAMSEAQTVSVSFCGKTVPIRFNYRSCGGEKLIYIYSGKRAYDGLPFQDLGIKEVCCTKVLRFNFKHLIECQGAAVQDKNGGVTVPEWNECCKHINDKMLFPCGHHLSVTKKRKWRRNKFIYKAKKTLQDNSNTEIFSKEIQC